MAGRYVIERELGRGGMATVYLARDLKHARLAALKVLRPELATAVLSERFLREIRIIARLAHPHILPLLDSGAAAGSFYYTMPFVEGESLRARLVREKALSIDETLRIASEVADALAYAHGQGVVHRDIKPENILIQAGHAVVSDFGIARALATAAGEELTATGLAIGTPAYMSPEQATGGHQVDARADIYSLGCVLYEMLAGSPPFTGPTAQALMARHAVDPVPSLRTIRATIPEGVERSILRALAKVPADRYATAAAFAQALAQVHLGEGSTPTEYKPIPTLGTGTSRRALVVVGAVLIATVAGLLWRPKSSTNQSAVARHTQLTFVGNIEHQDISPDAQFLAYIERGETTRLVVRDLKGGSSVPIATVGRLAATLRWSPEGSSILYAGLDSSGRFVRVLFPRLGGAPREVPALAFATFSRDGSRIAEWGGGVGSPIYLRALAATKRDSVRVPDSAGGQRAGDWSPDGRLIALQTEAESGDRWMLWAANVETGQTRQILQDTVLLSPPRWSADGKALYYIRNNDELCRIRIATDGHLVGIPEVLQTGLGATDFSIGADGTRLVYRRGQLRSNVWLATKSPRDSAFVTAQLTHGTSLISGARSSPDGRLIAFVRVERGIGEVYVVPVGGGAPRQVTTTGVAAAPGVVQGTPAWSPDGRQLAYLGRTQGVTKLRTVPVEGGRERIFERTDVGQGLGLAWGPADRILYQQPGNRNFHWLDTTSGAEVPLVTNDSVGWMFDPVISPDKQHVAVFWNRGPQRGVYVISVRDSSQIPVGPPDSQLLGWSRDGSSLYFERLPTQRIHRISLRSGRSVFIGTNPFKRSTGAVGGCDLNERPAGIALVCRVDESVSDVWMVQNFDPAHQRSH